MLSLLKKREPDHSQLDAEAAQADQQRKVEAAREDVQRLQAVIDQGRDATSRASDAEAAAKDMMAAWGRGQPRAHDEYDRLRAIADAAKREAENAGLAAVAASKNLVRANSVLQSAQVDLRGCENRIRAAKGLMLAKKAAPILESFERTAAKYRAERAEVMALHRVLSPGRYEDASLASNEGAILVATTLDRAEIKDWDREREGPKARNFLDGHGGHDVEFEELMLQWRERAESEDA
jgi:hypothetical protein